MQNSHFRTSIPKNKPFNFYETLEENLKSKLNPNTHNSVTIEYKCNLLLVLWIDSNYDSYKTQMIDI